MSEAFEVICLILGLMWVREVLDLLEQLWGQRTTALRVKRPPRRRSKLRSLKARSPDHCADCQVAGLPTVRSPSAKRVVVPWSERKSKSGRPNEIETEGYACANVKCEYEGVCQMTTR